MRHLALTLRSLARQPAVTVPVILTLALGIGANTALFANFIQIFWPTLDAPHSERMVWVYDGTPEEPRQPVSYPEYLDLRQGRLLQPADERPDAPPVAVVVQRFWRTLGGDSSDSANSSGIGRILRINGQSVTVVGVLHESFTGPGLSPEIYVPVSQLDRLTVDAPEPVLYFAYAQRAHPRMTMLARTAVPPLILGPQLRKALRSVSPDLAVIDLMTCNEQIDRGLLLPQMYAEVAALFGLLGLVVAVAGLFGLLSYSVSLRGREMGIRMAVGSAAGGHQKADCAPGGAANESTELRRQRPDLSSSCRS